MPDRHAFPAAGLDLHQRGCTYSELTAALVMAGLTAAAYRMGNDATPAYLALLSVEAADALCEALDHDLPDEGPAPAQDA